MIYLIIFLFLAILSVFTEAKMPKGLLLLISFLIAIVLIGFAGLRGDIEGDYSSYKDIFEQSGNSYSIDVEPGYFYLNKIVLNFGLPFQVIVFIMAIFSILPKVYFFRRESYNVALSALIFYSTSYFIFDFIQIRQAVAISIFMLSLRFIYERRFWAYLICIILAAQIHLSALIVIPGYFLFDIKYSKKLLYGVVLTCTFINLLHITVPLVDSVLKIIPIPGIADAKLAFYGKSEEFSVVSFKQLILGAVFIFIRDKESSKGDLTNIFVNLFIIGIFLSTCFNGISELSFRVKWYFFWTESILMLYVVRYLSRYNLAITYLAYTFLFVLYGFSLNSLLNEFASRGNSYIFPYKFFFQ